MMLHSSEDSIWWPRLCTWIKSTTIN